MSYVEHCIYMEAAMKKRTNFNPTVAWLAAVSIALVLAVAGPSAFPVGEFEEVAARPHVTIHQQRVEPAREKRRGVLDRLSHRSERDTGGSNEALTRP